MKLFFLPPYAPEFNPTELLDQDVHTHVPRHRPPTLTQLIATTIGYLATRTTHIISSYFNGEYVAYTLI